MTRNLLFFALSCLLLFPKAYANDAVKDSGGLYYKQSPDSYIMTLYGIYLCDTIKCDNIRFPLAESPSGKQFDIASVSAGQNVGSFIGSGVDLTKLPPKGTRLRYIDVVSGPEYKIKGSITIPENGLGIHPETTCYTQNINLNGQFTAGTTDINQFDYSTEPAWLAANLNPDGTCKVGTDGCSSTEYNFVSNNKLHFIYPLVSDLNLDPEKIFDETITDAERGRVDIDSLNLPQITMGIQIKQILQANLSGAGSTCMINEDTPVILIK